MDLKGYAFGSDGVALSGATVNYYAAVEGTPGSSLGSTTTDSNGMWTFTGLAAFDGTSSSKFDVKVSYTVNGQTTVRWYKGLSLSQPTDIERTYTLYKTATDVTFNNTTAAQTLVDIPITGNLIGTNGRLMLKIRGTVNNGTGGAQVFTPAVLFGGTTYGGYGLTVPAGGVYGTLITVELQNQNATNAQVISLEVFSMTANGGAIDAAASGGSLNTAANKDTTSTQNLKVTMQLNTASASYSYTMHDAYLVRY